MADIDTVLPVLLSALGTAFLLSLFLAAILQPVGRRLGLVDHPGGRKQHISPTPLVGGPAIFIAFLLTALWLPSLPHHGLPPALHILLPACALTIIMGAIDDARHIGVGLRFATQIAIALIVVYFGDARIVDLGNIIGFELINLGIMAVPFSIFALVGAMNAVNMSDGIDGLAGIMSAVSLILLTTISFSDARFGDAALLLALVGGILGFLIFNLRRHSLLAQVFLGDSGSTFLGFVIGYFLVVLSQGESRSMTPVTALWFLGVPLLDTIACMILRIRRGLSPFRPDRRHIHYLLLDRGLTVSRTLFIVVSLHAIFGLIGLMGFCLDVPEHTMFLLFVGLSAVYFATVARYAKQKAPQRGD